jgi:tetratricopeptide (TPR) repeat protein
MSRSIHRFFQVFYLHGLIVCLAVLISGAGCSRGFLEKSSPLAKQWKCDKEADAAMKRHEYAAAIRLHQRFLMEEPGNGRAMYHLGYAYGQTGDHHKEVAYYEKAIDRGFEKDNIFFNLGMAYGELNRIEKAIFAFKKAMDINPNSADTHFGLALAYQKSAADTLAEEEFLRALSIDPDHVDARLYLSMLYADMGEFKKASEQLRGILKIDPHHKEANEFLKRIEKE